MKYTIEGFSQPILFSLGLDAVDAVVLRWFVDFFSSGEMKMVANDKGHQFAWIKYSSAIEELPCAGIKTADGMARRFKKLADCGVLEHHHYKVGGSYSTYRVGSKFRHLITSTPPDEKSEGYGSKVGAPPDEKSEQTTLLLEDSSTRDKKQKHKHGEFQHVILTDQDLEKLKSEFPLDWSERIKRLDEYIEMKGPKKASYANHLLTIRNWARRDQAKTSTEPKGELDDAWRFHDPLAGKIKLRRNA